MTDMRQEFERFANGEALSLGRDRDSGAYLTLRTQTSWLAWQAATRAARQAGAGWKLVPVEPTPEMIGAGCPCGETVDHFDIGRAYRAMLAAAPSPDAEAKGGLDG